MLAVVAVVVGGKGWCWVLGLVVLLSLELVAVDAAGAELFVELLVLLLIF